MVTNVIADIIVISHSGNVTHLTSTCIERYRICEALESEHRN